MPHVVWVTNIPTPYRNLRYRLFARHFPEVGLSIEVAYMAESERGRHWRFGEGEIDHPHRVFSGAHLTARGTTLHVNPSLVRYVRRRRPEILVVEGYSSPTLVATALLAPRDSVVVLSSESTLNDGGQLSGPVAAVKRAVIRRCDAYVGPGERAFANIIHLDPSSRRKPFIRLPNIIDADVFRGRVDARRGARAEIRQRLHVGPDEQLWIIPARLELFKGLQLFLPLLKDLRGVRVVVAGEGSLRHSLEAMTAELGLPVAFAGQQSEAAMTDLYAAADLFVLPSLRDPSPLSAIEALAAGLPVLLSTRAGNVDEVVRDNGWRYDPDRLEAMGPLVRDIAALPAETLSELGRRSRLVYDVDFDSQEWARRVSKELIALVG